MTGPRSNPARLRSVPRAASPARVRPERARDPTRSSPMQGRASAPRHQPDHLVLDLVLPMCCDSAAVSPTRKHHGTRRHAAAGCACCFTHATRCRRSLGQAGARARTRLPIRRESPSKRPRPPPGRQIAWARVLQSCLSCTHRVPHVCEVPSFPGSLPWSSGPVLTPDG